jgi:hypothetical protein
MVEFISGYGVFNSMGDETVNNPVIKPELIWYLPSLSSFSRHPTNLFLPVATLVGLFQRRAVHTTIT